MSFFCAGSSGEAVKKRMKAGSKPCSPPVNKSSSNGRVAANPFQDVKRQPLPSIPFSDQPTSRRMMVIQDYQPEDNRGLFVKRGEQVQVLNQEGTWYFVRNESMKQGYVPSSHLVAPYTSTRSRKPNLNPIRPIASSSTISDMDPNRSIPMYPSHSAGRPLNMADENHMNIANTFQRHENSPQVLTTKDSSNNNNSQLSQGMLTNGNGMNVTIYDQKYSPSSSSGVASMGDPPSPSAQSFPGPSNSQENIVQHSSGSGSSLTQERESLSSIEEREQLEHGYYPSNGVEISEETRLASHQTNSKNNLTNRKVCSLPRTPQYMDKNGLNPDPVYSTISNREEPPPIPPRMRLPVHFASQGDQYYPEGDVYITPIDAIQEQPGPHLGRPRVFSLSDVRARDGYRPVRSVTDYSEVYNGKLKPLSRQNGYHHGTDSRSEISEGGSSNRISSKRSGSRHERPNEQSVPPSPLLREGSTALPSVRENSPTRISKFRKCLWGVFIVVQSFTSQDENELSVQKGDRVSVWNQDDREWFWIVNLTTSEEGFVPSCYLQEVLASEDSTTSSLTAQKHSHDRPPLPPKQYQSQTDDQSQFRHRTSSQESRSSNPGRGRPRINSDSSSRSRSSIKANGSMSTMENMDIMESPPNTPPPPYSVTESCHSQPHSAHTPQASKRHFSLSQHEQCQPGFTTQIARTRSQGHVSFMNHHGNSLPVTAQKSDNHLPSPAEVFNLRSPTAVNGGTLV